ncbi:putative acetyltransferase (GNAT) family [Phytophthora cinnamomi]|uniref:putative acetyltransferase (GNAT) family n=1 Tax=Phytophthora cinnamomi TaxID=4785 RepID=UPI00355991B1|nr:putative acetyltransferase (GNAT) family [Phytophthora cinnamomi]
MASVSQSLADVTIRPYCAADHKAVVQLYVDGMISYSFEGEDEASKALWARVRQASVDSDLADIEGVYFASGGQFWVAVVRTDDGEEEVIGMVGIQRHRDDVGELRRMSVKDVFRRMGLGRKLLHHLQDWAKARGFKRLELSTGLTMTRAVQFYKSQGYTLTHTSVFTPGMPHQEAHMSKSI